MEYFKLYDEQTLARLVSHTPVVSSFFDVIGVDIVNYGRVYFGSEQAMFAALRERVIEALEDQEQQDLKTVYQWLAGFAGLVIRRNMNQPWVAKHVEMQLGNHLIVFQTLADFAYVYTKTQDTRQRDLIKTGLDALLIQYSLQDQRFSQSDTEPSDPSDTTTETNPCTETTETTQSTQTSTTTQYFDTTSRQSEQRHQRNGYLYTFA